MSEEEKFTALLDYVEGMARIQSTLELLHEGRYDQEGALNRIEAIVVMLESKRRGVHDDRIGSGAWPIQKSWRTL